MKQSLILLFSFFVFTCVIAQKKIFLRIYDERGVKFTKGFFAGTTDSSLLLEKYGTIQKILFKEIEMVKTKRSIGHSIAAVTAVITPVLTILLVAGSGGDGFISWTAGEGAVYGLLGGVAGGLFYGTIAGALKNPKTFTIHRNYSDWLITKAVLDLIPLSPDPTKQPEN